MNSMWSWLRGRSWCARRISGDRRRSCITWEGGYLVSPILVPARQPAGFGGDGRAMQGGLSGLPADDYLLFPGLRVSIRGLIQKSAAAFCRRPNVKGLKTEGAICREGPPGRSCCPISPSRPCGQQEFEIPYNRQELADYLGVDRSAMSSELGKLRRRGVLDYRRSWFELIRNIHHAE